MTPDTTEPAPLDHWPLDVAVCSGLDCPTATTCARVRPDLATPWRACQVQMAPPEDPDQCAAFRYRRDR